MKSMNLDQDLGTLLDSLGYLVLFIYLFFNICNLTDTLIFQVILAKSETLTPHDFHGVFITQKLFISSLNYKFFVTRWVIILYHPQCLS